MEEMWIKQQTYKDGTGLQGERRGKRNFELLLGSLSQWRYQWSPVLEGVE